MPANGLFLGDREVRELGLQAVDLAANFPAWMRRRKTTYSFFDETTISQRLLVDFSIPDRSWFRAAPPLRRSSIYVPLNVADKSGLASFRVLDDQGGAASVLNAAENGQLAVEGFMLLVERLAIGASPTELASYRRSIEAIVRTRSPEDGAAAFAAAMSSPLGGVLPQDEDRALLEDLARGYLVLVSVPYEPGAHHVYELQWSDRIRWTQRGIGGRSRSAFASLGIMSKQLRFDALPVGWARSTHFEFLPTDDVRYVQTLLAAHQHAPGSPRPIFRPRRRVVNGDSQPTVSVAIRDHAQPVASRSDVGEVKLTLRPRRSGTLVATTVVATITTALLYVMRDRLVRLDAESSSAIMLVLPAVLAAFLARSGEHAIASRLLAGVRFCGLVVAALALFAAVLIGTGELRETHGGSASAVRCWVDDIAPTAVIDLREPFGLSLADRTMVDVRCDPALVPATVDAGARGAFGWLVAGSALATLILLVGVAATSWATGRARKRDNEDNP